MTSSPSTSAIASSSSVTTNKKKQTHTIQTNSLIPTDAVVRLLFQLTLVVKLLQSRQAAQHRQAIPVGICSTTGVFSQAQDSETGQRTQMAELREGGNYVLPQVELTQRQTPSQGRQR